VALSAGDQDGTVAAPGLPSFRTPGQQLFFSYRADATADGTAFAHGSRERLVPQAYWYRGRLGLLAEHAISRQEVQRAAARQALQHQATQLQCIWVLAGGAASFRGPSVQAPFDPAGPGRGAFEIVTRIHRLELDADTFPIFANPATAAREITSIGLGVNWTWSRNLRWLLQGERSTFEGGAAGGDREDETVLFGRMQVRF
jgi:phosphate-selective porin OprO/OprP